MVYVNLEFPIFFFYNQQKIRSKSQCNNHLIEIQHIYCFFITSSFRLYFSMNFIKMIY